jgi:glucose-1-phosphate adenylyltransferase
MLFDNVQAVVVGLGTERHLYPLTKLRSKPAVPIGGQFRLIDIPISNCINSGITRIFVLTQFLSASLNSHLSRTYRFSVLSRSSVEILATEETPYGASWCQGPADAVRRQMGRILSRGPEEVLILAGDHLYRTDLGELVRFHRERQADVTIFASFVSAKDRPRYDPLEIDAQGRVSAFRAESQSGKALESLVIRLGDGKPGLAPMGVYLFRTDALAHLLETNSGCDFARHILPAAIHSKRTYAYQHKGYWEDLSSVSAFYQANLAMAQSSPPFDLCDPQWPIYTPARFLPPSRIDGCRLERTMVANGCQLYHADVEGSVIGLRSVVGPGVRLNQVVMMGADSYETTEQKAENRRLGRPDLGIGRGTFVERTIIDTNVRIGRKVFIGSHEGEKDHDERLYAVRDGIVVIPENTVIPDGTTIGVGPPDWMRKLEHRHRVERKAVLAGLAQ